MHIGLIVGIGPAATDFYYRRLITTLPSDRAPLELTMVHADAGTLLTHQATNNIAAQVAIYVRLAERLKSAGAQSMAITSIAGHFCVGEFAAVSPLPVINMVTVVKRALTMRRLCRIGILGTRAVMDSRFYGAAKDIEIIAPADDVLDKVHDTYVEMATSGTATTKQREILISAGRVLTQDYGAEAVMLAGTDLHLAFGQADPGYQVFDCAALHADAIADAAATPTNL